MLPGEIVGEVFNKFMPKSFIGSDGDTVRPSRDVELDQKDLGACVLTCREWSMRCRRTQFEELYISSAERLSEILNSQRIYMLPRIPECVLTLHVRVKDPSSTIPWIHRIMISQQFRWGRILLEFGDRNDRAPWNGAAADFMTKLPRRIPLSLFGHVSSCEFVGTQFRSHADFLRATRNYKHHVGIRCQRVTFPETSGLPPAVLAGKQPGLMLLLVDCQNVAAASELLRIAFCFKVGRKLGLPFSIVDSLTKAAVFAGEQFNTSGYSAGVLHANHVNEKNTRSRLSIEFVDGTSISVVARPTIASFTLSVELTKEAPVFERLQNADWLGFETALEPLAPRFDVEVTTPDVASFAWLVDSIGEGRILENLHASGKMEILLKIDRKKKMPLREASRIPLERTVDKTEVVLTRQQAITLSLQNYSQEEEERFLRQLAEEAEARRAEGEQHVSPGIPDPDPLPEDRDGDEGARLDGGNPRQ